MLDKDGHQLKPHRTNVVDRLRMNVNHVFDMTVSQIHPTNGDWTLGNMCDLKSWQIYFRTAVTNEVLVVEKMSQGEARYWRPSPIGGSMLINDFAFPPTPRSPAVDVLLALSKYDSTIEELRKASALPNSRFPLNYEDMLHDSTNQPVVMMMHLASIIRCIQVLNLRAVAELENNQGDRALDDVKLAFRLVNATRVEPSAISQYQRTEELKIVLQAIWEGLVKHRWTDAQLAAIELELGKLDFLTDSQLALRGQRNETLVMFDYLRKHRPYRETWQSIRDAFADLSKEANGYQRKSDLEKAVRAIYRCLAPSGSYYQNKVIVGIGYQQWSLKIADPAKHEVFPKIQEAGSKFVGSFNDSYRDSLAGDYLPGSLSMSMRSSYAQETADLARTACALERYRLAHDGYPDSLDVLAPQFIDKIPHDIIGGKPLHYRRTADGKYLLYSVGWNEVDDGGKVGFWELSDRPNNWLGDWVWPCDASPIGAIYVRP